MDKNPDHRVAFPQPPQVAVPSHEELPSNWSHDPDGYRYTPWHSSNTRVTLSDLFKPGVWVRFAFGAWGIYTKEAVPGPSRLSQQAVWHPYMDGRAYPTHLAAMIAAELEINSK